MLGSLTATVIEDNGAADVVLTGGAVPAVYDGRTATDKGTLGTEQSFKLLASTDNTGAIMSATGIGCLVCYDTNFITGLCYKINLSQFFKAVKTITAW